MVLLVQVAVVDFLEYQVIQVTAVLEFQDIVVGQEYQEQMVCQDFLELADIVDQEFLVFQDTLVQVYQDFQELVDFQEFLVFPEAEFLVFQDLVVLADILA